MFGDIIIILLPNLCQRLQNTQKEEKEIMKKKIIFLTVTIGILFAGIYYYIALPALNIHSVGFWKFIMTILAVIALLFFVKANKNSVKVSNQEIALDKLKFNTQAKIAIGAFATVLGIFLIGSLLGSPIVNAKKYQQLLTVNEKGFSQDMPEVDYSKIPILDKSTAILLGDRKMGNLVDMVSQFEAGLDYIQINYQGRPTRVTPLEYASGIKWLTNQKEGLPGYIRIDMTTQETEVVMLEDGMKYSKSEMFNRNIYRHLRFNFPTYIFDEQIFFEIDEEGIPYWVAPVKKFNIGLFGGQTVSRVVTVNAITGECNDYEIEETPEWVDKIYRAELLVQLYDYYGLYVNGYLNTLFSQKGCLTTTNDYNYVVLDDDLWVYTGVTSLGADQSNVGFILMNQRTMETKYYVVDGAIEDSAMGSAEGAVQNLGYNATFPLLINIGGEPTYFMALKDQSGLVKQYAMVNVSKFQLVATGESVKQTDINYRKLLADNGIDGVLEEIPDVEEPGKEESKEVFIEKTVVVSNFCNLVIDGNTHIYAFSEGTVDIYDMNLSNEVLADALTYKNGETIKFTFKEGEGRVKSVTQIEWIEKAPTEVPEVQTSVAQEGKLPR